MDALTLRNMRSAIEHALTDVAKDFKVTITPGKASYGPGRGTMMLDIIEAGGMTAEAERYVRSAEMLKLPRLNVVLKIGKDTYKLIGLNTTGSKVYGERIPDNKVYLLPVDSVRQAVAAL